MMKRRQFLAITAALCAAGPVAAEKLSLPTLSDYLNGMRTAKAPFTQVSDDGTLSTGQLYLKRPGRARFEYDPPSDARVIAGGGVVAIVDPKSNQPAESYPLNRTPLSIILAPKVDLARANMVVGHAHDGTATIVTAQDPDHPDYGRIELMFTDKPVELRKWVIHDGSGTKTTVILGALETGMSLSDRLFSASARQNSGDR